MTSKIAIIADIHGNLPAFKTILKDIKNQNIGHIIFPGDMITDCPDSNEVLNIIREMNCTVIKGNREQYCIDYGKGLKAHWTNTKQMSSLLWSFKQLSPENREFISNLQQETVLKMNDISLRIVHGSPDSISELIFPEQKKERFEQIMTELKENILICGHSHQQWDYRIESKLAVNPGSAGVHFNKNCGAEYSILTINGNQVSVNHRQIPYDIEELEKRFVQSGLYGESPFWSESIIKSIREGENVSLQFLDYAVNIMETKGIGNSPTIPDEIWDLAGEEYLISSRK